MASTASKKSTKKKAAKNADSATTARFGLPASGYASTATLAAKAPKKLDALVVPVFSGDDGLEVPLSTVVDGSSGRELHEALTALGATGASGELTRVLTPAALAKSLGSSAPRVFVAVGLGDAEELDDETIRRAAGAAARSLAGFDSVGLSLGDFGLAPAVEGALLGSYHYRGLRSTEEPEAERAVGTFHFIHDDAKSKAVKTEFDDAVALAESVTITRDLVNTPSSHLYPETYAGFVTEIAQEYGLGVEVLDDKELEDEGFGGILAVGKGSSRKPRLVRLTWAPKKASAKTPAVALVGKGITFDTGGISLKPGSHMEDMISDMGGSAAVVGTMAAIARQNLPIKVTATIPMAENMPSGEAQRPGDVITHYGGLTSEIINTDAEGRLVLADAIARACEDEPDYLLETATLTGAQMVALGSRTAGIMGSDEFRDTVAEVGRSVGEPAWAMPLLEEQEKELKSPTADIRNSHNSRQGGMLFAGLYLSKFVSEGVQWAHVDVAGPAWNDGSAYDYTPKRATGTPVRTFVAVLHQLASK